MTFVLGTRGTATGPTGRLGTYRALDGSEGASLAVDLDRPHAVTVVGKRGYGKSYTLGVLAEELADATGLAPVVLDPMGELVSLAEPADDGRVPATVVDEPTVSPGLLDPESWCRLLGLSPESAAGSLLWQAVGEATTLDGIRTAVEQSDASPAARRAADNHLAMADRWGVFDAGGTTAESSLASSEITVLDLSGLDRRPMAAVVRAVCEGLYQARVEGAVERLPWVLLDEAHAFFDGVAEPALRLLLTRGRSPGVSLVLATQRPSVVPEVAVSQSDLLVAHRLTAETDIAALEAAQPTYAEDGLGDRIPTEPGEALIVDDTTETVHVASVRERRTPHGGGTARASAVSLDDDRTGSATQSL